MLRPVAAGTDGSPESLAAAHRAARWALRRNTVVPSPSSVRPNTPGE